MEGIFVYLACWKAKSLAPTVQKTSVLEHVH